LAFCFLAPGCGLAAFRFVLARFLADFARFFDAFALRADFGRVFFAGLRRRTDEVDLDLAISVLPCAPVDPVR
jgi:hypothetical protein